ncbi:MAG: GTPase domain-containing protein [Deltaproteobacteria bacterium]|nr:GTPase domain-containing protein [Deltaproteobacteria bacterium]
MVYVNIHNKLIELKIVYYGAGMSGKTTNLIQLHQGLREQHKGQMVSLATESESTIFFDFFPVELGQINGMSVRLRMYTVPGQDFYEASRRLVLEGADGVVFVIDSDPAREPANYASYEDLCKNLKACHSAIERIPVIFQYNKRDIPRALAVGSVEAKVGFTPLQVFEAVASRGEGVKQTAQAISRSVVERFAF